MSQENVEIARQALQLFQAGGIEASLVLCDDALVTRRCRPCRTRAPGTVTQG